MRRMLCLFYVSYILMYFDLDKEIKTRVGDKKVLFLLLGRQENISGAAVRPINTNLARFPNCPYD